MTIVDTYDNFIFILMIVFLFICFLSIITLIMFNIKSRNLQNPSLYSNKYKNTNQNSNSIPTLQCTPRQTLVGNVVQLTC